ncbi:MAG TPA: hypothetical protein VIJ86_08535 [Acidimicrobiales bacterium]
MSDVPESPPRYIDDSLGQRRLLRSKLNDNLSKLLIAVVLAGGIFFGTASGRGTTSMEVVSGIIGGLLLISVAFVLIRFFVKRSRIIAKTKKHGQR